MLPTYSTNTQAAAPDYIVIVSNEDDYHASFHHFAEKVNRKLRAGYQLHGQPFNIDRALCQALVRLGGAQQSTGETTVYFKRQEEEPLI
jgi:hypothetical protein